MIVCNCALCGEVCTRLDTTRWHCPRCGSLMIDHHGATVLGAPVWALRFAWLLRPIQRIRIWWVNPFGGVRS